MGLLKFSNRAPGISWLRQAFHEHPDLVLSGSLGVFGIIGVCINAFYFWGKEEEGRMYKHRYIVLRAEDAVPSQVKKNLYN